MKEKIRGLAEVIRARIDEKRPLIQVVLGPRQVGKTTALQTALNQRGFYASADYPTPLPYTVLEEWWQKALTHPDKILAIDEIQKIPGWSEVLKKLWDRSDRILKVVVTGSSALLVEKGLKETLAGRFELIRAEHWNFAEARDIFGLSLESFIDFGCYPGSVSLMYNPERWSQYVRDSIVEPALGRDILQLHPVDRPALLRQIFGVAVSLPCQIVSLQKLQGQLQGKGALTTLQHYLRLLSDAYLVSSVEKYHTSPFRSKKSSPKLLIHDNGLIRAFRRPVSDTLTPEERGRYFENAVGARFLEAGWNIFYWKERELEVDFVVLSPEGKKMAVEVKTSETTLKELAGLLKFCQVHPDFEPCLLSLQGQHFQNITSLSWNEILSLHRKY